MTDARTHIEIGGDDGATAIPVNRREHEARAIAETKAAVDELEGAVDQACAQMDRLRRKNARLTAALQQCEDYFDGRADVVDGSYGEPAPNAEMQLLTEIREALS